MVRHHVRLFPSPMRSWYAQHHHLRTYLVPMLEPEECCMRFGLKLRMQWSMTQLLQTTILWSLMVLPSMNPNSMRPMATQLDLVDSLLLLTLVRLHFTSSPVIQLHCTSALIQTLQTRLPSFSTLEQGKHCLIGLSLINALTLLISSRERFIMLKQFMFKQLHQMLRISSKYLFGSMRHHSLGLKQTKQLMSSR